MSAFAEREHRARLGLDKPLDEPTPKVAPKKSLSMDEIESIISEIAQDSDAGPDRFRALKALTQMQTAGVNIPAPVGDEEVLQWLTAFMVGSGPAMTQMAYKKAFPHSKNAIAHDEPRAYADASPELVAQSKKITSLKLMYKHFPESRRRGVPKGFPSGRSPALKMEWCQDAALKMLVEREHKDRTEAHSAMKTADDTIRGATDGTPTPPL